MTDDMKRKLIELRDELERLAETGKSSEAVVKLDQTRVGRLSRMDAMQAQAMATLATPPARRKTTGVRNLRIT